MLTEKEFTEKEISVLEMINGRLLIRRSELKNGMGDGPDGVYTAIQKLVSIDCLKMVEPMGEKCFVITKKGSRHLREARNPESVKADGETLGQRIRMFK